MAWTKEQESAINNSGTNIIVSAGAGSGKTLTIIAKVKYLIERCNVYEDEILCLSFTNETVNNLSL